MFKIKKLIEKEVRLCTEKIYKTFSVLFAGEFIEFIVMYLLRFWKEFWDFCSIPQEVLFVGDFKDFRFFFDFFLNFLVSKYTFLKYF